MWRCEGQREATSRKLGPRWEEVEGPKARTIPPERYVPIALVLGPTSNLGMLKRNTRRGSYEAYLAVISSCVGRGGQEEEGVRVGSTVRSYSAAAAAADALMSKDELGRVQSGEWVMSARVGVTGLGEASSDDGSE